MYIQPTISQIITIDIMQTILKKTDWKMRVLQGHTQEFFKEGVQIFQHVKSIQSVDCTLRILNSVNK